MYESVFEAFEDAVRNFEDHPFLHIPLQATQGYSSAAVDYTYGEAWRQVIELQQVYRSAGYGIGHRVAVMLDNRAEFIMHFLALNGLGVSIVPINSGLTAGEIHYILDHSDASMVLALPEHLEKVSQILGNAGSAVPAVSTGDSRLLPVRSETAMDGVPGQETEAVILYTSGTTGKPKGCILTMEYCLDLGNWYMELGGYCQLERGKERLITPLPLAHINALFSMMAMIMCGGCIIQLDRFHASTWWETVRESNATCLHYLGVIPAILLKQAQSPLDDFRGQIKFGFGSGVDPAHHEVFEKRFGFPLIEGWAMTETGTSVAMAASREPRHVGQRCMGKPLRSVEYRLVDEEGNDVPRGEPGELLIRRKGDNPRKGFFSRYYKDEKATEAAWAGGYFHTGDVVRVDAEGSFYFVDRRKNVIRRSGENIAGVEVEGVLLQNPLVANCAVIPIADELRGEEVGACVVLKRNAKAGRATAENLFSFCSEHLIYYKVPGYFLFVDELPMTGSQRVQRGQVKKLAAEMIENGEHIDLCKWKKRNTSAGKAM